MINFKSIPFLKILFPYLIGIVWVLQFGVFQKQHVVFEIVFLIWIITFLIQKYTDHNGSFKKWVYVLFTNLLLFLLAFESCYLYNAKNNHNHYSHYVVSKEQSFIANITDIPVVNKKFIKLFVQINSIETHQSWHYAQGNTIIYLKNDSSLKLALGNTIFVTSKFSYVNEPTNPEEFNYKAFLEKRNIFHTIYTNPNSLHIIPNAFHEFSFFGFGTKIKANLVDVLRRSRLSQEAFSICSALLVGYDDEIDNEVMQSFSHSGTLHILSVSGMHTGVLYGILIFVFSLIDKYDKYKKTKFAFVLFFLLLFVFITGLSPSVLRAALMLSLVLFGKTFYKQGNSYNTLLFSAFLLLLVNPYLIIDIGFLLSYFAVFGIMYFYPILSKLHVFENKILQWLWSSVLISVAATVFTLPISLYYFHQFPIWFALSNLIIIPISMFIMIVAALIIVFYKIIFISNFLAYIVNGSTSIMLWFAKLTDNSTYGFIDFVSFSIIDLLFMSLVIGVFLSIVSNKQYKHIIALCLIIVTWLSVSIYNTFQDGNKKELVVFNIKQKSAFVLRVGQRVYGNFNGISEKDFQRYIKPYLLTISNLKIISTQCNALNYSSVSILLANQSTVLVPQLNSNYIIVSNNTPIELTTNYKTKPLIIADCSNNYKFVKKLKKQCALLDLPFYWVKESGALQIKL